MTTPKKKTFTKKIHCWVVSGLTFLQRWWRTITCIAIAGSMFVNGVFLPLMSREYPDLMGLAALVTAISAAFAVREWRHNKDRGNDNCNE